MTEFNQNIREWGLYSYQLQAIFHCFACLVGYFSWCPIFHGALFSGALFSWVPYFLGAPFSWCPIFLVPYFLRCPIFQGALFSGALYSGALSSGALFSGALYSHHLYQCTHKGGARYLTQQRTQPKYSSARTFVFGPSHLT